MTGTGLDHVADAESRLPALRASLECALFGLREAIRACEGQPSADAARGRATRALEAAEAALEAFEREPGREPVLGHAAVSAGTLSASPVEGSVAVVPLSELRAERTMRLDAEARAERVTALLDERWDDVRLMHAGPVGAAFGFNLSGGPVSYIAEYLAEMLGHKSCGDLSNYAEIEVHHRKLSDLTMTLQRKSGKTPHQLRREAEAALREVLSKGSNPMLEGASR